MGRHILEPSDYIYYKKEQIVRVENGNNEFCFIDYDDRSANTHMIFQHAHVFYEIFLLIDEQAEHLINGIPYALEPGDIVCLAPQVLHKSVYPPHKKVKRLVINFSVPEEIFGFCRDSLELDKIFNNPLPIYRFQDYKRHEVFEKFNEIFRLISTKQEQTTERFTITVFLKLFELVLLLVDSRSENTYTEDKNSKQDHIIKKIVQYIHENYSKDVSLSFLSKKFHLSPSHLSREFKRVTHFTLTDYVRNVRVKNAQYFLLTTDFSISAISTLCGFNSFSQFNRCFQNENNMAPREYRKAKIDMTTQRIID